MHNLYKRLLEFTHEGVYRYTFDDGVILLANQGLVDILDLACSPADLVGRRLRDVLVYVEQEGSVRQALESTGQIRGFEYHFRTLSGKDRWVLHDSLLIEDAASGRRIVEAIVRDITERREAEERIRHLNAVLRAIRNVNQLITRESNPPALLQQCCEKLTETRGFMGAWIGLFEADGRFRLAAGAGSELGTGPAPALVRPAPPPCARAALAAGGVAVLPHCPAPCADCPIGNCHSSGAALAAALRHGDTLFGTIVACLGPEVRADDDETGLFEEVADDIAFALHSHALDEQRRRAEQELARHRDRLEERVAARTGELEQANQRLRAEVSERERAERRLEQAMKELERSNKELELFAYVASHDLQEPLRTVGSFAALLARRYKGRLDQDADEFIGFLVDGAARAQTLINALLEYSRVNTRGRPPGRTDVGLLLDEVLSGLQVMLADSGAEVHRSPMPTVTADAVQLGQVFQNLVANAVKFGREHVPPRVEIAAERKGGEWEFSVRDNGIGIDPRHYERIFVIFQRLHGPERPGTGLGLAICRRIVERHGGRIWVESEPGRGSVFKFTIPAGEAEAGGTAETARPAEGAR